MTWVAAAIESFQAVWLLCKKNRESQYGIEEATSNGCYATDEYHLYIYKYTCEMLETAKAVRISLQATVSQNHNSPETPWYFHIFSGAFTVCFFLPKSIPSNGLWRCDLAVQSCQFLGITYHHSITGVETISFSRLRAAWMIREGSDNIC